MIAAFLLRGYQGVGGVLVYRELQEKHPDEYKELKEITRKALLVAEDSGVYDFIPTGYVLDETDPDLVILNRDDGTFVAAFSARGVTVQGILDAVREDRERRKEELGEEG